ncbi:TetR family transcriptional regulator [Streptomyces virginiae]|uniref:TetR family transcriptional regulator n=1 Tax=Streptomyces virginiae TaxID=1961 RepID=A0ABQ3NTS8_STRVG|nr:MULTISPECIES: TetR/AcrR family transcriptional regulator [Streptomyces]GLV95827.1 TetR family transcriptional regulator [Streptomyces lavendulae subsp. lavendulae]MBP2341184.1 AcrR family transcriptional regulator [Streptomyces virginiae]QNE23394.1 TetR/AcrR family transcriptional regulator [Streptomyces sp. INR7]GGQ27087.1 TetR family transcriptional regulator [Streptomyces virginiae]GHI16182.1 TetR family transcriptional regulator [Streptomyces virginiae]
MTNSPSSPPRPGRDSRVARLPPRERILDAAEELFLREGVRAVGVQAIADRANTTKMALYRHFATKDALIEEWLRIVAVGYATAFDRVEAEHPHDGRAQVLGVARFIAEGLPGIARRGCPFVNSIAGLPDPAHPARRLIENHKADQRRRLTAMCARAGAPAPDDASAEITFLLEGAQISAQNASVDRAGDRLVTAVSAVLDRGTPPRHA